MNNCIVHFAIVVLNAITTLFRCLKRWRLPTCMHKKQLQLSNIISFAISVASLQQCLLSFSIKLEPITSTKQVLPRPQMIPIVRMKLLLLSSTMPALGHVKETHNITFPFTRASHFPCTVLSSEVLRCAVSINTTQCSSRTTISSRRHKMKKKSDF